MSRIDRLAFFLCICSLAANALIARLVFENIPHLEDEMTLVWQAETIARGQVMIPSPPSAPSFFVPFVIDYQGWRFGKYPLGFPVVLAAGIRLGARDWINPLLGAWGVWLVYRLGKKLFDEKTGLLAAFLTASSPFFLIQSGSLLTHTWSLFLSCTLALAWLDTFYFQTKIPRWLTAATAGGSIGLLALTRPWTAVGVALPFILHGLYLLIKGSAESRRGAILVALIAAGVASIYLLWQAVLTGSPWTNPYTLWWSFDRIGFGPGVGVTGSGHNLLIAVNDAYFSLIVGSHDLFGWPYLSWIFILPGLWAAHRNRLAILTASVFPSLVVVYLAYWVGAWLYGPRYYFEGLFSLTLLSAAGIMWCYRNLPLRWLTFRPTGLSRRLFSKPDFLFRRPEDTTIRFSIGFILLTFLLGLLIGSNFRYYLPARLTELSHLYGIDRAPLAPFESASGLKNTPALVVVHPGKNWRRYSVLLEKSSPFLDTPFIFAISQGDDSDTALAGEFPGRKVIHYYPDQPWKFYLHPLAQNP